MLIQKEIHSGNVSIKDYQPGLFKISGAEYTVPLLISAQTIQQFDLASNFCELTTEHYQSLVTEGVEIILIGTGEKHQFIEPAALALLNDQGIAVESMATRQACHTFQVLTYEKRHVIALLFP